MPLLDLDQTGIFLVFFRGVVLVGAVIFIESSSGACGTALGVMHRLRRVRV